MGVITFALLVHSITPKWGIRLQNLLGVFKIIVLLFIVCSGFAALAGVSSCHQTQYRHLLIGSNQHVNHLPEGTPHFNNFKNAFSGTKTSANAFVSALYNGSFL